MANNMYQKNFSKKNTKKNVRKRRLPSVISGISFPLKKILRGGTIVALLYICVVMGEFLIYKTDYFRISGIQVKNTIDKERIKELIYYSGILPRQHIFDLNLKKAESKICTLAYVESVKVKRDLSGIVKIIPKWRSGNAVIKDKNEFVIVDSSRTILKRTNSLNEAEFDLPLITGFSTGRAKPGTILRQYSLQLAFDWLEGLPEEYRKDLSEISVRNYFDTIMVFKQGMALRVDTLESFNKKKHEIDTLISYLNKKDISPEYIDVRFDVGYIVKKL